MKVELIAHIIMKSDHCNLLCALYMLYIWHRENETVYSTWNDLEGQSSTRAMAQFNSVTYHFVILVRSNHETNSYGFW